jgi:hypothetical protein
MGAWGTSISSNDTYADIYAGFFDLYNDGLDVEEISRKLIADNQDTISDNDDSNNFWFALAKAQWECKQLDKGLLEQIKQIVETGADLEVWKQLEADEKDIKKRKVVLDKFLADLQTERPKAKTKKKKIIVQPVFKKGDCLTFKLENGNYGGAVVLEAIENTVYGHNLIALTRINQPAKPTKKDYENAEVLFKNYASWNDIPSISWYNPIRHKDIAVAIEAIEKIDVQIDYDINQNKFSFIGDFETSFIKAVGWQLKSEETKPRSATKQTIKELTKKSKWKLW